MEQAGACGSAGAGRGDRRRDRALAVVAFLVVLALSVVVRVGYAEPDPSYDELWNLSMTRGLGNPFDDFAPDRLYESPLSSVTLRHAAPTWAIWTHMSDRHPPLYEVTLRAWRVAFGESSGVAQAYSIAWSCGFAALAFLIARASMGVAVATLLGVAQALSPTQVYLAQEVRNYEMVMTIGAAALWLMTRIETSGGSRRRAVALGALTLPLLLTHYFALGVAVAIGIFGCWRLVGHRRLFLGVVATSALIYGVIWVPFALRQLAEVQHDEYVRVEHFSVFVEAVVAATTPYRLFFDLKVVQQPLSVLGGALLVAPWFLQRRLAPLRPWALWLACTVASLFVLDASRSTIHLGYARYAAVATPAVLPLAAGCAYAIRRRWAIAVAGGLAVLSGYELHAGTWIASDSPVLAAAPRFVARSAKPGEGVIVFAGYVGSWFGEWMMLQCSAEPGLFPRPAMRITRAVDADVARRLPRRAWLIAPPFGGPIDSLIPSGRILWHRDISEFIRVNYIEIPDGTPIADAPSPATARVSSP